MGTEELKKEERIKLNIIMGMLLLYIFFLMLKINGCFDFTSRYGIEWINNDEWYNSAYLIDDDTETTWGLNSEFEPGSMLSIKFKEKRSFSEIAILNVTDEATAPMSVYVSSDGEFYFRCITDVREDSRKTIYDIPDKAEGEYLLFMYEGSDGGHWPITEVQIGE